MPQSVIVIGAGVSGLAAAHRITELAPETHLQILEASGRVGGLIRSEKRDGFLIEQGPDAIITEKPAALALAQRLGLHSQIIATNQQHRGAFVVNQGQLQPIPQGFSMMAPSRALPILRSPILSVRGKVRMLIELVLPRSGAELKDESTQSFVERRFGQEVLERLAQPLMGGIYGTSLSELSLRATMPRFAELETRHRSVTLGLLRSQRDQQEAQSGVRYGLFFSFKDGVETLTRELSRRLESRIRRNCPAKGLEYSSSGFKVILQSGEHLLADKVICALPAPPMAALLSQVAPDLHSELEAIPYGSTATVAYAWPRGAIPHALNGFGFVVPSIEKHQIIASTWASRKFSERAPPDHELLRVFFGGAGHEQTLNLSDDELVELGRQELRQLLGVTARPLFASVARQSQAMPKYVIGHLARVERIAQIMQRHPCLALAGNSLHGVGIPDAVAAGERAAERVLGIAAA